MSKHATCKRLADTSALYSNVSEEDSLDTQHNTPDTFNGKRLHSKAHMGRVRQARSAYGEY